MMNVPKSHHDLIDRLGAPTLAAALEVPAINVRQWKMRNRIPAEHWSGVIELANERDISGVNARWLLDAMPPRKRPSTEQVAA